MVSNIYILLSSFSIDHTLFQSFINLKTKMPEQKIVDLFLFYFSSLISLIFYFCQDSG